VLTVRLYAERKGWTLDRIETRVTRDAGEGKINSIELELLLGGDLSDEQRQRLAEIASRCPIHRTLAVGGRYSAATLCRKPTDSVTIGTVKTALSA
jgi:putative redox protein